MRKKLIILVLLLISLTATASEDVKSLATIRLQGAPTYTTAPVDITGLQENFNQTYYKSAGGATTQCVSGQSTQPSGTKGSVSAPSTGGTTTTPDFTLSGLPDGSNITIYGWAQAANGLYYPAGVVYFTTPEIPPDTASPHSGGYSATTSSLNFSWTNGDSYTEMSYKFNGGPDTAMTVGTSKSFSGLSSDTYYLFVVRGKKNGVWSDYYSINGKTATPVTRPSYYYGFNSWTSGSPFYGLYNGKLAISLKSAWTNFQTNINQVRVYKGYSNYNFTSINSGDDFTAALFNEARSAISTMNPSVALPGVAVSMVTPIGENIKGLQNSLNSIN